MRRINVIHDVTLDSPGPKLGAMSLGIGHLKYWVLVQKGLAAVSATFLARPPGVRRNSTGSCSSITSSVEVLAEPTSAHSKGARLAVVMLSSSNARRKAVLALSLVSVVTVATFVAATPAGRGGDASVTPVGSGYAGQWHRSRYMEEPGSNGGYSITSFVATAEPGSKSCKTTGGTHRCVIAGLANGKSYRFAVKAGNEKGYGPAATTSAIVIGAPRTSSRSLGSPGKLKGQGHMDCPRQQRQCDHQSIELSPLRVRRSARVPGRRRAR